MRYWIGLAAVAGCSGGQGSTNAHAPTYWQDVQPLLAGRCLQCHEEGGIGEFPLATYAEVHDVGEVMASTVEARLMPPWKAAPGPAYLNDPSLTDAQIAMIRAWVVAGMPEGDPGHPGSALPSQAVALPRVDATLQLPSPYLPTLSPDEYRCFVLPWSGGETYVTGFEVHPGNSTIVHHSAAFLIRPDGIAGPGVIDTFDGWDPDGSGYSCFGGPAETGQDLEIPVQQIAQWVPGEGAVLFPDGVGIPIVPGSLIVLQMHYNTVQSDGSPDQTSVDLMIADDVEQIGAFAPYLNPAWTLGGSMVTQPGTTTTYKSEGDPVPFFGVVLGDTIDLSNGFTIYGGMLHMHTLGQTAEIHALRASDGASEPIVSVPSWDFNWQLTYELAEPIAFAPGDELSLSCTFHNTTDAPVDWGENTEDEMCVGNLFVSAPK